MRDSVKSFFRLDIKLLSVTIIIEWRMLAKNMCSSNSADVIFVRISDPMDLSRAIYLECEQNCTKKQENARPHYDILYSDVIQSSVINIR
jgi:hypothetical protein